MNWLLFLLSDIKTNNTVHIVISKRLIHKNIEFSTMYFNVKELYISCCYLVLNTNSLFILM